MKIKYRSWPFAILVVELAFILTGCNRDDDSVGVKDIDGNGYTIVTIGSQVWMAENLATTKYNDGSVIPLVTDNSTWSNLNNFHGYCWQNNDIANKAFYGALYNWFVVSTGKLCPAGWHVPTDAEWTTLENYLVAKGFNFDGTTTSNKYAKALASDSGWDYSSETGAVGNSDYQGKRNATGFAAIPCGWRDSQGYFSGIGSNSYWWSSTGNDAQVAQCRSMSYYASYVYRENSSKNNGFSVRCLKN